MSWDTCCGCMLWVTVTYVVENMFTNVVHNMCPTTYAQLSTLCRSLYSEVMLWVHVVDNSHLCCGAQIQRCCRCVVHNMYLTTCFPQHVTHTIVLVIHNMYPQHRALHVMLCMTVVYVVEHRSTHVVHNIQMLFSTTCTHNIGDYIYCGRRQHMLWIYHVDNIVML